ncbi:MAG: SRPBCC family protein [Nitriliruptorales bacterium]
MRVEVAREVFAPRQIVWHLLVDWERQAEWMVDARAVEVETASRRGVGVRLKVPTRVLGVTIEDRLEVTGWNEPRRLEVRHIGALVSGQATFELTPIDHGTGVVWWEEIEVPLGTVGELAAALLVRPYLAWVFRRSLDNFARICRQEAASTQRAPDGAEGNHGEHPSNR